MKIPANLKHKPVIISENYENIDIIVLQKRVLLV